MMMKPFFLLLSVCLYSAAVFAAEPAPVTPINAAAPLTSKAPLIKPDLCPEITTLTKKGLFWSAPDNWVSYGESFDTQVLYFVKAEWVGINFGKIICLYRGEKRFAFPIALEQKQAKLAPSPTGGKWSKDLGGRKECVANSVKDCPFFFKKEERSTPVYDELDFFKGKSNSDY